jgi:predicted RNA binding protein YcfA (HicA-like mRNA interferase family)
MGAGALKAARALAGVAASRTVGAVAPAVQAAAQASSGMASLGKLPALTAKDAVKLLRRYDFAFVRQRGSHATYRHADGRQTVVPMHNGDLRTGTVRGILQQAGLGAAALGRR